MERRCLQVGPLAVEWSGPAIPADQRIVGCAVCQHCPAPAIGVTWWMSATISSDCFGVRIRVRACSKLALTVPWRAHNPR